MIYRDFKNAICSYPYFTSAIFGGLTASPRVLQNQVNKWVLRGDLIKLRRGLYTLNPNERKVGLSKKLLANVLYSPSYISLEYALSFYDMIPEGVYAITSISARKTSEFTNELGVFIYKSIKTDAFFGFTSQKDEFGYNCLIATPEKALLDYFYFNVPAAQKIKEDFFDESMRLQNISQIDLKKLKDYAQEMNVKKILKIVEVLEKWLEKEKG